ncbi:MAG: VOC family protein [Trueperaceae bacterium]
MKMAMPYLMFDGNTEEAFDFYKSVFGGEIMGVVRYGDFGDSMPVAESDRNKVANIALPLGDDNDKILMASDTIGPTPLTVGNNVYVIIEPDSTEEAERFFDSLAAGGQVEMSLQSTQWAEKHGMCTDRFGIHWMVNYTGSVQYSPGR